MNTIIMSLVWCTSCLVGLLMVWCVYLFTIREWLDRRMVRMGKAPYDGNGLRRWNGLFDEVC